MSYQYGQTCFSTAVEANNALAFDKSGQVTNSGTQSYVSGVGTVTATTYEIVQYRIGGGYTAATVVPSVPPPCNLLDTSDAVAIGWLLGGVWLSVYAITFLKRIIEKEDATNDT